MSASDLALTSLRFTEEMKGFVTFGELDHERDLDEGKRRKTSLMFHLTIRIDDVEAFVSDPMHEGSATGWVGCEQLGGQLAVERGVFNLFVDDEDPRLTRMLYRLWFADGVGHPLTLTGFKEVKDDPGLDLWQDTTTLYTRLLRGHLEVDGDGGAEVVASGKISIQLVDFLKQLTTFRVEGPSPAARAGALADFGRLFLGKLWDLYGDRLDGRDGG